MQHKFTSKPLTIEVYFEVVMKDSVLSAFNRKTVTMFSAKSLFTWKQAAFHVGLLLFKHTSKKIFAQSFAVT